MIDTSRFFWSTLKERISPFWSMYSQFRPLLMLPFNIWFFFASLPFRFFFYFTSFFYSTPKPITQVKQKIALIKEEVNNTLPESLKSKAPIELRARKSRGAFDEERPFHGFYSVEKNDQQSTEGNAPRKISLNKKESTPSETSPAPQSSETDTLRSRIAEMEQQSKKTADEKMKLEQQLENLSKRLESDETALSQVESERTRFKNLINIEQRKCFDFQQQIVALKSQLKMEHDAASASLSESKKSEGKKKQKTSAPAPTVAAPAQTQGNSSWHGASHTQDYTELVAKAQREEEESGKTFSEVLKEAIKPAEAAPSKKKDEFTVVGGVDSTHHIFAPVAAV